jgi:hypothetical protein
MTMAFIQRSYSRGVAKQALPVAAGVCLALAACGSGMRAAPPPTKAAFVARADRICARARTRSEVVAGLSALRAPAGYEGVYSRWLKAERDARGAAKTPYDPQVVLAVAEGKIAGYARRLGAETCAKRAIGTMPP